MKLLLHKAFEWLVVIIAFYTLILVIAGNLSVGCYYGS